MQIKCNETTYTSKEKMKRDILLRTYKVKCDMCNKSREVIQRYKPSKPVRCIDCKRIIGNKRAREYHANNKLKKRR